jgi:flagellar biosynthetic protein FlhB
VTLRYNLQFFAEGGDKTEPATEKKLSDARKEGQVAKSREIANGLGLLGTFVILKVWAGYAGKQFLTIFSVIYEMIPDVVVFWNGDMPSREIAVVVRQVLLKILTMIAPILAVGFLIAFLSDVIQVGWKPTSKPMQPKLSKLNPASGIKKIFSVNSLVELVKSIAKIGLIAYISYGFIVKKLTILFNLYDMTLMEGIQTAADLVISLGIRISAVYMIIAAADFAYQKIKFAKDMRMTKQEIKDEYKQSEGDPQIKGKIKQKMQEASRRRMMQSLPQADVVITNPTHFAVAIKYDSNVADAPIVIAKGEDYMAAKIKEAARSYDIEIVENKPLARMLYANVDVGQAIPPELYQAVAEVLAYVYHLKGKI